jgi:cell division septal protein FtsQ
MTRRKKVSRLRPFWMVAAVGLLVVTSLGYVAARWPGFRLHRLTVVGNAVVPTSEIVADARINRDANIWFQNTGAMARRIAAIPYIENASVHRFPPGSITIVVTERRPFANVRSGARSAVIDRSLRVLELGASKALPTFVVEAGLALVPGSTLEASGTARLRDAYLALAAQGIDATSLYEKSGDTSALLTGGVHVLLGDESDLGKAVPLVEPILARFTLLGRRVRVLDLRAPETPVVTASTPAPGHLVRRRSNP